jgi:hypothetical protein
LPTPVKVQVLTDLLYNCNYDGHCWIYDLADLLFDLCCLVDASICLLDVLNYKWNIYGCRCMANSKIYTHGNAHNNQKIHCVHSYQHFLFLWLYIVRNLKTRLLIWLSIWTQ